MTGAMLMIAAPVVGMISDRYGRLRVMRMALVLVAVTTYPLFFMLTIWPTPTALVLVQAFVGLLLAICLGALPALLADIYPTATRGTGLALSYNFSVTLFGGFAPLIVTWLIDYTHSKLAPSFYVMATSVVSLAAVMILSFRARTAGVSDKGIVQPTI
jgi:MHS family proline/betaine transporter-like MFS transporter